MALHHAEISGVSLGFPPSLNVVLTSVVEVYNPNSYDVAIRGMRGQILIADRYTIPMNFQAQGDGLWLAAKRKTQARIPVNVPIDLAMQIARETYTTPTVTFRCTGTADVTASRTFKIEKDNYSIDERGVFERQQLTVALGGMGGM